MKTRAVIGRFRRKSVSLSYKDAPGNTVGHLRHQNIFGNMLSFAIFVQEQHKKKLVFEIIDFPPRNNLYLRN